MARHRTSAESVETGAIDSAKRESTIQLLFRCGRILNEQALERLRDKTGRAVRASHTALLPHIDFEGTRLTDIAERAGLTKQAVGPLVDELVDMGLLERVPDPADGRARRIRFSAAGRRSMLEGLSLLRELEDDLARGIGRRRMKRLHDTLLEISDLLDTRPGVVSAPRSPRGLR